MRETLVKLTAAACLLAGLARAESAIFWVSAPVEPGQAVLVTGYFPQAAKASIKVAPLSGSKGDWHAITSSGAAAPALKATECSLSFELPTHGGAGVYGFRIEQPNEQPLYGRVNLPEIWWTLTDVPGSSLPLTSIVEGGSAVPGSKLRVFGRCLSVGGRTINLALISNSGQHTALRVEGQNPYSVSAILPVSLASGSYTLIAGDSASGDSGLSAEFPIQIRQPLSSETRKVNAADFGVVGDGHFDNTGAIRSALAKAAQATPAIVSLPAGGFLVSQPLEVPAGVYLSGVSADQTALYFPEADPAPEAWVYGSGRFGLLSLSIFCGNHKTVVSSDMSGDPETSGHIRLHNVRIRASAFRGHIAPELAASRMTQILKASGVGFETVRLSGPDIVVDDCDFLGSSRSLVLYAASGAILRHNRLFNGMIGWYNINSSENVIFENNTVEGGDLLSSGGSYSTWGNRKRSQNFYTAGNTYQRMLGWDREAFTSDGGGGAYYGGISKGQGVHLTLQDNHQWGTLNWQDSIVAIVSGRGQGQWRQLKTWNGAEIEISKSFDIAPDNTSKITIVPSHLHYIFYRNSFQDSGIAIQFYGTAVEHVVAENESSTAGGFYVRAVTYAGGIQPELNLQFLGNRIKSGNSYHFGPNGSIIAGPSALEAAAAAPSAIIGLVLRNNDIREQGALRLNSATAMMKGLLVEGNKVADPERSLQFAAPIRADLLLR